MRLKIEVFVALCLIGLATSLSLRLQHEQRERQQAEQVRDSLFLEDAAKQAALNGWSVQFGVLQEDMGREFAKRDSMAAALVKSLDRAHATIRSLTDVVVTLNDSLTVLGAPGDTTEAGVVTYTGQLDDGLLRGSWRTLGPSLSLAYGVTVPLEIVHSEGGDGRWLVTARSLEPKASVSVAEFWINPPAPVHVAKCTLTQTAWRFGLGVLAGAFVPR